MAKFAVGYLDFSDNDLQITIVEAGDWVSALESVKPGYSTYIPHDDFDAAKNAAFDQDWVFDIKEIH